jgi:hypothetical protein
MILYDAAYDFASSLGIENPAEDFIDYLVDTAEGEGSPEHNWRHIDRVFYDRFCEDQRVEAQVERYAL